MIFSWRKKWASNHSKKVFFAWYPVLVEGYYEKRIIWLEYVERKTFISEGVRYFQIKRTKEFSLEDFKKTEFFIRVKRIIRRIKRN